VFPKGTQESLSEYSHPKVYLLEAYYPWPEVVAYIAIIPATREQKSGRSELKASPGKKFETPISTNKPGIMAHYCDPNYMGGHRKEDHNLRLAPVKNMRPYLKNN
jgi:hypothetical protein